MCRGLVLQKAWRLIKRGKTCVYAGAIFLGHLQRSKHKGYLMPQALEQAKDGKWRAPTGQRIIK